ncbi:MAG: ribonuclease D, partial [Cellulomonadaceae bacterium]|nr:ribonuclease D [Cellulomonadaceae bacterium]
LPSLRGPGTGGPPRPNAWPARDPQAAVRLAAGRAAVAEVATRLHLPVENLLLPDTLLRVAWEPPPQITPGTIARALADLNARQWQIENVATPLAHAFANA